GSALDLLPIESESVFHMASRLRRSITEQELHLVDAHPGQVFDRLVPVRSLGEKRQAGGLLCVRRPAREEHQVYFRDQLVVSGDLAQSLQPGRTRYLQAIGDEWVVHEIELLLYGASLAPVLRIAITAQEGIHEIVRRRVACWLGRLRQLHRPGDSI